MRVGQCDVDIVVSFVEMDDKPSAVLLPHVCWSSCKFLGPVKVCSKYFGVRIFKSPEGF